MQKVATFKKFTEITATAPIITAQHGERARCLQRLIRLGMPVPRTVALSFETVTDIAGGQMPDIVRLLSVFGDAPLLSVRPSSQDPDWGGPGAVLNIGMNRARYEDMIAEQGETVASVLYLRFIRTYAAQVTRLDAGMFDVGTSDSKAAVESALQAYEVETDTPFPQDPSKQLSGVLRSMARAWASTSARLLRQAKGAPLDAGLGLVVQEMALGVGPTESGSGVVQFIDPATGQPQITGRYISQGQGRDALVDRDGAIYLTRDPRGPSLEELCPEIFDELVAFGERTRQQLREEMQLEFTIQANRLAILDAVRVPRNARASVRIAVALAEDGVIDREQAILRIPPRSLNELLHPQIDPQTRKPPLLRAIPASPGAAVGKIVFSSSYAQTMASQGEACILVKRETAPGDVRGMHAAQGVLTERGGATSHAAVIARGLGVPCVVGASQISIDRRNKTMRIGRGRTFREGDMITIDGTAGEVMAGAADMLQSDTDSAFETLLDWADSYRDIGVRANADTPEEAQIAETFRAEGIGLCRTEHMFFAEKRLGVMRELIFADRAADRADALSQLLPMQRADFTRLFQIMAGKPVCIRLLDPPLHEFLPQDRQGILDLAEALGRPFAEVSRRIGSMSEFNPMLGLRGVRLGITVPEIYDMQARAIFEAALDAAGLGAPVAPEIMIPLVSARREVELVRGRVDAIAMAVQSERTETLDYSIGVMVETPRAAIRADDIADNCAFLSFGTNDLTQMTYGLSRDDAGRFMAEYVRQGVFREDPFHVLDRDGVGELLQIGIDRARTSRPGITVSVCGEHAGNGESIAICREMGVDYVSCSPYRVPLARLAAAQHALKSAHGE